MNRTQAREILTRIESAHCDGGEQSARLVRARLLRHASRWEMAALNLWVATDYLDPRYPHMWPLAKPWVKFAFRTLIYGSSKR